MGYKLLPPVKGFSEFELYRYPYEDEVYVYLKLGGETAEYLLNQQQLTVWLRNTGCLLTDKVVDTVWSNHRIHYKLPTQHLKIPPSQFNPYRGKGPSTLQDKDDIPFNVREIDGGYEYGGW